MSDLDKDLPDKTRRPTVMVVEDDPGLQRQMVWAFSDDFTVLAAGNRTQALEIIETESPGLVVLDLGLPPDPNGATEGLSTLSEIIERRPRTKVVIASGNEERAHALRAVSLGAYDFFTKPVDYDELRLTLLRARRVQELEEENRRLSQAIESPLDGIIYSSPQMAAVSDTIRRVAGTDVSILIQGESGTGKELIARAIHGLSQRVNGPFMATNCAAIPENLLESELFGYERGAFTGAAKRTMGKIEAADGGTLFLDEIGDMPFPLQSKLLRFLQERKFQRLGSQTDVTVHLRVVSATNRDLKAMIASGTFREDLYFRLNEISVFLPPLRDRSQDQILIANALIRRFADLYKRPNIRLTNAAVAAITSYSWPGNVRELENKVKRAILMANEDSITPEDLGLTEGAAENSFPTLKDARLSAEKDLLLKVIGVYGKNMTQASKVLGISRPTLYALLGNHGIRVEESPE